MNTNYSIKLQTGAIASRRAEALNTSEQGGAKYACRFVRAGTIRSADNRPTDLCIPAAVLQTALLGGHFSGKAVFIDHAAPQGAPSLRNLVGVSTAAAWNEENQAVDGVIQLYDTADGQQAAGLLDQLLAQNHQAPDVGLSLVFWAEQKPDAEGGTHIAAIRHIESIDLVFQPAADGRVLHALSANQPIQTNSNGEEMTIQDTLQENQPNGEAAAERPEALQAALRDMTHSAAQILITHAGLPKISQERLLAQRFNSPAEVQSAIETERAYLAALVEDQTVQMQGTAPRTPHIQLGRSGFDQLTLAADALMDGVRPPDGIRPLSGIRELYNLLSGDYELTGLFHPERVQFANVNSTTMASLVANAINKRVVNEFSLYPHWWEPFSMAEDFESLQDVRWITLAGIGELPTVAEGAAYSELQWDDKHESASFVKKGGYLGITMEAVDRDDTRRLRTAPRALAQAAYLTLAKSVSALFTANSGKGPTLSDGSNLFDTGSTRGNLGSSALSVNAWASTRAAMRRFPQYDGDSGSAASLGSLTAPHFLLVPPELESTALQVLGAESYPVTAGSGAASIANPFALGDSFDARLNAARARVIVVDLWSDSRNWAAVANPRYYPTLGIAYRYGRTPEVFSVAAPNSGLMFTNDVMPVKVRFFFAVAPMDWRGMYKHNV